MEAEYDDDIQIIPAPPKPPPQVITLYDTDDEVIEVPVNPQKPGCPGFAICIKCFEPFHDGTCIHVHSECCDGSLATGKFYTLQECLAQPPDPNEETECTSCCFYSYLNCNPKQATKHLTDLLRKSLHYPKSELESLTDIMKGLLIHMYNLSMRIYGNKCVYCSFTCIFRYQLEQHFVTSHFIRLKRQLKKILMVGWKPSYVELPRPVPLEVIYRFGLRR